MGLRRRLACSLALALAVAVLASGAGGANGAGELTFYPQAGILWQDLYPSNFVDLDPGPGVRDFACGTQTYDGHLERRRQARPFDESAALSDVLRKGLAGSGKSVQCAVTPSDGRLSGGTAVAAGVAR